MKVVGDFAVNMMQLKSMNNSYFSKTLFHKIKIEND